MPLRKCAKKALRQNISRRSHNLDQKTALKSTIKGYLKKIGTASTQESQTTLQGVYKALDRAVSQKIIHKNKAARLKSRLTKRIAVKK